jgi:hypothetical protein
MELVKKKDGRRRRSVIWKVNLLKRAEDPSWKDFTAL